MITSIPSAASRPPCVPALIYRAQMLRSSGRFAEAVSVFARALKRVERSTRDEEQLARIHFGMARCLWALGDRSDHGHRRKVRSLLQLAELEFRSCRRSAPDKYPDEPHLW